MIQKHNVVRGTEKLNVAAMLDGIFGSRCGDSHLLLKI